MRRASLLGHSPDTPTPRLSPVERPISPINRVTGDVENYRFMTPARRGSGAELRIGINRSASTWRPSGLTLSYLLPSCALMGCARIGEPPYGVVAPRYYERLAGSEPNSADSGIHAKFSMKRASGPRYAHILEKGALIPSPRASR